MFIITCPNCGEQKELEWNIENLKFKCLECKHEFIFDDSDMEEYSLIELERRIRQLKNYEEIYLNK